LRTGPPKIASETSPDEEVTIANNLRPDALGPKQDWIVISPYFVPEKTGAMMRDLVARGVHIRILTNSLAVDRFAPGAQRYSHYACSCSSSGSSCPRCGPSSGKKRARLFIHFAVPPQASAKALVIDQKTVSSDRDMTRVSAAPTANSDS